MEYTSNQSPKKSIVNPKIIIAVVIVVALLAVLGMLIMNKDKKDKKPNQALDTSYSTATKIDACALADQANVAELIGTGFEISNLNQNVSKQDQGYNVQSTCSMLGSVPAEGSRSTASITVSRNANSEITMREFEQIKSATPENIEDVTGDFELGYRDKVNGQFFILSNNTRYIVMVYDGGEINNDKSKTLAENLAKISLD